VGGETMKRNIKELFNLEGKVIILTGAAGLLGQEYADILSEAGADVVLVDIKSTDNQVLHLMELYHTHPYSCQVDISSEEDVKLMCRNIILRYGKIDILINNAIEPHTKEKKITPLNEIKLDQWKRYLDVNLTGIFICCKVIGSQMEKQGFGNIINISSIYGIVGVDQRIYENMTFNSPISYAATKGAMITMSKWLASYWRDKGIRVNILSPGGVNSIKAYNLSPEFIKRYSEKTILGRMANEWDYRGAMLFLCSDASEYMTGSNLVVDGGWTAI
jgi:NAD(P)-dependent dehydrogenase (short-subunit alcohol dehydrogenase family)